MHHKKENWMISLLVADVNRKAIFFRAARRLIANDIRSLTSQSVLVYTKTQYFENSQLQSLIMLLLTLKYIETTS